MENTKKILVTGATGFLGGRLVEVLAQLGNYQVIATGRNKTKGLVLDQLPNVNFVAADLCHTDQVQKVCKGVDTVVHTAARSSLWGTYQEFHMANIVATQNIVNACQSEGVKRLVHISTPSIYAQKLGQTLWNVEESVEPKMFISDYAKTKYAAELIVQEAFEKGLETIILRPRAIYGRGDFTIMPRFLRAYHTDRLKIIGDGNNVGDMTHVLNVVDAILLSIHADKKALGQTYNITDGKSQKVWEVVQQVLQAFEWYATLDKVPYAIVDKIAWGMEKWAKITRSKEEPILTRAAVSIAAHSTTLSILKAKKLLNYTPKHTLAEGIEEFVTWWRAEELIN